MSSQSFKVSITGQFYGIRNRYLLLNCRFRLLLHTENPSGAVVPMWEHVHTADVADPRTVMESKRHAGSVELNFVRIPVTAERPPGQSHYKVAVPP